MSNNFSIFAKNPIHYGASPYPLLPYPHLADPAAVHTTALIVHENPLEEDFAMLYHMGVIDHTGRLASHIDQRPCLPTPTVIAAVASFLQTPIGNNPRLHTPLQLLLQEQQHAYNLNQPISCFKIVGSLVPYLLQAMLPTLFTARLAAYKGAAELLCRGEAWHNLTRLPRDYDMRSETPYATLENIHTRLNSVAKRYVPLSTTGAAAAPFTKFIPAFATQRKQCEEPSLPTYEDYILVAINDLDYCAGSTFKRSHLFENSNLQLKIYADSLTPDLSQLRIEITSERGQVLQALFDRAYKRLRIHAPENVDYRGATNWQSTIVAGSIPCNSSDYFNLLDKLIADYQIIAPVPTSQWSQRLTTLLARTAEAHNDSTDEAKAALTLQFELNNAFHTRADFPPSYQGFIGQNLWKWLPKPTPEPLFNLRIQHNLSGQHIAALLHIGAWLKMGLPEGCGISRYAIAFKSIDGQPAVRYTLNQTYHLLVPLSLHDLKAIMQERSFQCGVYNTDVFEFLAGCYTHQQDVAVMTAPVLERYCECFGHLATQPTLAYAEECLAHANPFFQLVSTALLIAQAALGNTTAEQLLLCKALPQLLQAQAPLTQWGRDIATAWLYYRAASQQQQASIQAALIQLQEDATAAPVALWQALLATGYPPYRPWIIQNTLALCNCASLTADQQQLAWYTAYLALRSSDDENVIIAALPRLLHYAEVASLPIAMTDLLSFSQMIHRYIPTETFRLLPLWQRTLKAVSFTALDHTVTEMLLICCQKRLLATHLPPLARLAPIGQLCSCFTIAGMHQHALFQAALQKVLIPTLEMLLQLTDDSTGVPLCEHIASYIDESILEGEDYVFFQRLISYLSENSSDINVKAHYTFRLCQEQTESGEYADAIETLQTLTNQLDYIDSEQCYHLTQQLFDAVLVNTSKAGKTALCCQLLSIPTLTPYLLEKIAQQQDTTVYLRLCQKLVDQGQLDIARQVALLIDTKTWSPFSRLAKKHLLTQLGRASHSPATTYLSKVNSTVKSLQQHLRLDVVSGAIKQGEYVISLKNLDAISQRLHLSKHSANVPKKLLERHIRSCLFKWLEYLLLNDKQQMKLAATQQILHNRYYRSLLGSRAWSSYITRCLEKALVTSSTHIEDILVSTLSAKAKLSADKALLYCQAIKVLPTQCSRQLLRLLKSTIPRLIDALQSTEAKHLQALGELLVWIGKSKIKCTLTQLQLDKLIEACEWGIDNEAAWLTQIDGLSRLRSRNFDVFATSQHA